MKLVDRYVLSTFLKNYLISFMVLVGMYVVLDMVFNFDELVDVKGSTVPGQETGFLASLAAIGDYYFYQIFLFFVYLSGIIPVVAAAFTLMRLSRFNELTALLAAGVPLLRVAMPIILAGVVLNGLLIADQELVIPTMIPKLTRSHDEMRRSDAKSFPILAMQDDQHALVRVGKYTPPTDKTPATMQIIDITERQEVNVPVTDAQGNPKLGRDGRPLTRKVMEGVAHITADSGVWDEANHRWNLTNGKRQIGLRDDAIVEPDTAVQPWEYYQNNGVTPEEIALYRSGDWVELLSSAKIEDLIQRPGSYGQTHLLRVKHWRFTQPIMNVILLLLAIPCVLTREPGKLKAAATKCLALTGLGMGAIFISHQVAGKPPNAEWAQYWPAFAAWAPVFIFLPLSIFLLDRVKT
jgi:lipopolysaccharide export system permease protein